jgi:8-amino-7-oxononanoate synthase
LHGPQGVELTVDGRRLLSFCSNDYLGLANHPAVRGAFEAAVREWGVGSGASHLITGHSLHHRALEEELAELTGYPRALLFSTGYMANLAVGATLLGRGDALLEDRLNHASLVDAGLLSRARLLRYPHADWHALDRQLAGQPRGRRLVMTDGVFSMDGDLAPLDRLAEVCERHGAWLMVDDAHGLGVVGPRGRGTLEHFGIGPGRAPVLVGTLGKAFGTFGAFVAGSEPLIETLVQSARPYVYTTALPPAVAAATRASLRLLRGGEPREALQRVLGHFRQGAEDLALPLQPTASAIQPLVLGDPGRAVAVSRALEERGILVPAIRPPTVPPGSSRLRITFSAAHTDAQVDRLLEVLSEVLR